MIAGLNPISRFYSGKIVMLRKRSRPVSSKQSNSTLSDEINSSSLFHFPGKIVQPTSYFFNSPKISRGFFTNFNIEADPMTSSVLVETRPFSPLCNPFSLYRRTNPAAKNNHHWNQKETKGIGLALIDSLILEGSSDYPESPPASNSQERKRVLFGSQLKIKVPSLHPTQHSPNNSPAEFGIKTPRSNFCPSRNTDCETQPVERLISMDQLSEDYTRVITHGPNPKTTHIYGEYCVVVDSSCGEVRSPAAKRQKEVFSWSGNRSRSSYRPDDFLRFCSHCNVELGHGKDIYMYRGDKAFCSEECRCQAMRFDAIEQ